MFRNRTGFECAGSIIENNRKVKKDMAKRIGEFLKQIMEREADGVGVVEMILILVVLIALVIIFQDQLTQLVNNIFSSIRNKAGMIY